MIEECLRSHLRSNVVAAGDDVWAGDGTILYELAEADIRIIRDAGTANCGHARLECPTECRDILRVRVRVDQAGQDVLAI